MPGTGQQPSTLTARVIFFFKVTCRPSMSVMTWVPPCAADGTAEAGADAAAEAEGFAEADGTADEDAGAEDAAAVAADGGGLAGAVFDDAQLARSPVRRAAVSIIDRICLTFFQCFFIS